ncbi:hypothetical protein NM208_g13884 [Fusarium decemcellulare]|uniref:Uncharacterized protein n=1 Tax=Fusarium decemcellulare TaxID=57161 RepID=A0ACC1RJD0_9HYPO|nr:hypothetical protein NM208_g13884 [Fusarium decemcellulare]
MLIPLAVMAAAVLASSGWWKWGPHSSVRLPEHLMAVVDRTMGNAYETLFKIDPSHHASPPLFYHLLSVPTPTQSDDEEARLQRTLAIITQLDAKTKQHYEAKRQSPPGTVARKKAQDVIDLWNKVGAVLLDTHVKAIYDIEVLGPVKGGQTVGEVLMSDKMCKERWANKGV